MMGGGEYEGGVEVGRMWYCGWGEVGGRWVGKKKVDAGVIYTSCSHSIALSLMVDLCLCRTLIDQRLCHCCWVFTLRSWGGTIKMAVQISPDSYYCT